MGTISLIMGGSLIMRMPYTDEYLYWHTPKPGCDLRWKIVEDSTGITLRKGGGDSWMF